MKIEDALRKLELLRRVTPENGFSQGETENAVRLANSISRQHAIRPEDLRPVRPTFRRRPSWFYWRNLSDEFGLELRHFGRRGSVSLDRAHVVMIRGDTSDWFAQKLSARGWEMVEHSNGLDSLRSYLMRNTPRTYTFHGR